MDAAFNCQRSNEGGNCNGTDSMGKKTKVSRTLTEKRKDYVRRASANPEKRMETYQTLHRTFKSPVLKTFSVDDDDQMKIESVENVESTNDRIAKYKRLIEENQPSMAEIKYREKHTQSQEKEDINSMDLQPKLFQVCLLVGYNTSTKSAYLKMKYPPDEEIPDNIEQLIFPSADLITNCGRQNQEHCLILTDENGFKIYGYCRRVFPENSEYCLPLCYCVISVTKSLGFFHKLLKEIEIRHGQSEQQMDCMLKNLQDSPLPLPGKYLHTKVPLSIRPKSTFSTTPKRSSPKRLSLEANPKWLQNSPPTFEDHSNKKVKNLSLVEQFEESKKHQQPFDLSLINRSLIVRDPRFDEILIRRPSDLRLENIELSTLLDCMGVETLLIVFSNLLLERKVILQSSNISVLSKSIIALQTILYPFQWQFSIVTIIPSFLIHICEAPFPVIAGVLEEIPFEVEDGIVVNLDTKRIVQTCNDEQTIIPDSLRESLKLSLEMVDLIDQGKMLSSVLISEAFLRFFIELYGVPSRGQESAEYHKEEFIQRHESQNIKFFLEWFVETSMFRNFINDRFVENNSGDEFYKLFNARILEKCNDTNNKKTMDNIRAIVTNSKIINKKGKTFKEKFKKFFSTDISEGIKF